RPPALAGDALRAGRPFRLPASELDLWRRHVDRLSCRDDRGSAARLAAVKTAAVLALALLAALALHLAVSSDIAPSAMLALVAGAPAESHHDVLFVHAMAPRAAMAILVGAGLGLAGSLLQGVTRNRLVSPLTIGASSGAWFALLLASVLVPEAAARAGFAFAMAGALVAAGLALGIAGRNGFAGIPLVLAGMALHILFG